MKSTAGRIIVALLLGLLVHPIATGMVMMGFIRFVPNLLTAGMTAHVIITNTTILILSLALIGYVSGGRFSDYGFKMPKSFELKTLIPLTVVVAVVMNMIVSRMSGVGNVHWLDLFSVTEVILLTWILSPICVEILARGLVQGYMNPLRKFGFNLFVIRLSVPIVVAALYSCLSLLPGLMAGMTVAMLSGFAISLFAQGLIAGTYRERSGSVYPAIVVTAVFNICGTTLGWILP